MHFVDFSPISIATNINGFFSPSRLIIIKYTKNLKVLACYGLGFRYMIVKVVVDTWRAIQEKRVALFERVGSKQNFGSQRAGIVRNKII